MQTGIIHNQDVFEPYEHDTENPAMISEANNDTYDSLLPAELQPLHQDKQQQAVVKCRYCDSDGNVKGRSHDNPYLDTRIYDVEFDDGNIKQYATNVIAKNILTQVDIENCNYLMLDEILDHRQMDTALTKENRFVVSKNDVKKWKKSTQGWELQILWKDGSTSWVHLKDMKDSYPVVEVAEYAVTTGIEDQLAF